MLAGLFCSGAPLGVLPQSEDLSALDSAKVTARDAAAADLLLVCLGCPTAASDVDTAFAQCFTKPGYWPMPIDGAAAGRNCTLVYVRAAPHMATPCPLTALLLGKAIVYVRGAPHTATPCPLTALLLGKAIVYARAAPLWPRPTRNGAHVACVGS